MDGEGRTQVLLEQVQSQVGLILEVVTPYGTRFDRIDETLVKHEFRLDRIEGQLSGVIAVQKEHSADLREIKQIVGGHAEAITELKAHTH